MQRDEGTPKGKDWDAFMQRQSEVLEARTNKGWEFVTSVGVNSPDGMREASRTSGVLLYFRRN